MNLHTEGLASDIHAQIVQCEELSNHSALILSQCKQGGANVDPTMGVLAKLTSS